MRQAYGDTKDVRLQMQVDDGTSKAVPERAACWYTIYVGDKILEAASAIARSA